jgi:PAS domain S-box-containing protein
VNKQAQHKLSSSVLKSLFKSPRKGAGSSVSSITKLIEHYAYVEAIVAALDHPMVIIDKSLRVKSANNAFFKLFKYHKNEVYGKSIFEFNINNIEVPYVKQLLKDVLVKNIPLREQEFTHKFERVGEKTLLIGARRIVLDEYNTKLILLSIEDISERKKREIQKDDFIGYVTHELKTPLTSMNMFIEILTDYHKTTKDKKSQFLLAKAKIQMDRLGNLLNSFANVYKAQVGKLVLRKERFDLNMLVKEVVETFQYSQSTHDIQHVGSVKNLIEADRERINEVIVNLLSNAIKYSPQTDKIIINLTEDERSVSLSVEDFGPGIPKDKKEKIFERFYRVEEGKSHSKTGLGLGLYIVSEIIKAHKGKLWVHSTEGKGSTFFFSIPKK